MPCAPATLRAAPAWPAHEAVSELKVQLWANAETQPMQDALVEWPSQGKQHRIVATIRIPEQEASSACASYFDEVMTFCPAHSLAAHQPLGSVMRARLQVYHALFPFRHRENGVTKKHR